MLWDSLLACPAVNASLTPFVCVSHALATPDSLLSWLGLCPSSLQVLSLLFIPSGMPSTKVLPLKPKPSSSFHPKYYHILHALTPAPVHHPQTPPLPQSLGSLFHIIYVLEASAPNHLSRWPALWASCCSYL